MIQDTTPTEDISYRLAEVAKIKKINMAEIEANLSSAVQINYINWDESWTPKPKELPKTLHWNFFDSTQTKEFTLLNWMRW